MGCILVIPKTSYTAGINKTKFNNTNPTTKAIKENLFLKNPIANTFL